MFFYNTFIAPSFDATIKRTTMRNNHSFHEHSFNYPDKPLDDDLEKMATYFAPLQFH